MILKQNIVNGGEMMNKKNLATQINLSEKQETILNKLAKGTHTKLHHKERALYILLANEGMNNSAIAQECDCHRKTIKKWRDRWNKAYGKLAFIENEKPHKLQSSIESVLDDEYRSGAPQKFLPEQVAEIINLACQSPESFGLPFTHWSNSLLANETVKKGIVNSISSRQIGRFLNDIDLKPHLAKGWLNPKIEDPELFKEQVIKVCNAYKDSPELEQNGTHVLCTDEMTGIQALQHCQPNLPAKPGLIERYEQEYIRKGTSGAIVSRNVATGEIVTPLIQPTRKEVDFVQHIENAVKTDPDAKFIFIMDQLNTHKSESLVRYIIDKCNLDLDEKTLGEKGESGILESMTTRAEFLSDSLHDIHVIYTPKHSSWLNQVELWFSILKRHLLNKRASFKSVKDLEERIQQYIDYYNENLAKPFMWTYSGKLLKI